MYNNTKMEHVSIEKSEDGTEIPAGMVSEKHNAEIRLHHGAVSSGFSQNRPVPVYDRETSPVISQYI